MLLEMNIPNTPLSLAGIGAGIGSRMLDVSIKYRANRTQAIVTGNRCGHDPKVPRYYFRPENHQPRPSVLEEAITALKEAYHFPKKFLQRLKLLNPTNRQKRSERREAIVSVSQALLHYLELVTLKVGFNTSANEFVALDLHYIAEKAGTTVIRARRAIKDLDKAGYIKLDRQFKRKNDGSFIGLPSIREITVQFFADLGIDLSRLFFYREWKRKKEEKKATKKSRNKLKGIMQAVSSFPQTGKNMFTKLSTSLWRSHPAIDKVLINQALALHRENPARSPSDYLKELLRKKE